MIVAIQVGSIAGNILHDICPLDYSYTKLIKVYLYRDYQQAVPILDRLNYEWKIAVITVNMRIALNTG